MSCSIFIRSFRGDREWLGYCLRSLAKFAKGFEETVVVIPNEDHIHFDKFDFHGARPVYVQPINCSGYIAQQFDKIRADEYVRSEWIMFVDSDCFVKHPIAPADFFASMLTRSNENLTPIGAKAIQLIRPWDSVGDAKCWKAPTDKALGFDTDWETMAAMPLLYNRNTLKVFREHIFKTHQLSAENYIQHQEIFSEFNALGNFALRYQPHLYDWRVANPETDGYCRAITQRFSHGGLDQFREEYERILAQ